MGYAFTFTIFWLLDAAEIGPSQGVGEGITLHATEGAGSRRKTDAQVRIAELGTPQCLPSIMWHAASRADADGNMHLPNIAPWTLVSIQATWLQGEVARWEGGADGVVFPREDTGAYFGYVIIGHRPGTTSFGVRGSNYTSLSPDTQTPDPRELQLPFF